MDWVFMLFFAFFLLLNIILDINHTYIQIYMNHLPDFFVQSNLQKLNIIKALNWKRKSCVYNQYTV